MIRSFSSQVAVHENAQESCRQQYNQWPDPKHIVRTQIAGFGTEFLLPIPDDVLRDQPFHAVHQVGTQYRLESCEIGRYALRSHDDQWTTRLAPHMHVIPDEIVRVQNTTVLVRRG